MELIFTHIKKYIIYPHIIFFNFSYDLARKKLLSIFTYLCLLFDGNCLPRLKSKIFGNQDTLKDEQHNEKNTLYV